MKKKFLLLCFCCISGMLFADVTYHVSPSGNNGNDGSQAYPFKTVAKAVSVIAESTPTIIYLEKDAVFIENSDNIIFPGNINLEIIGNNTTIKAFATPPTTNKYQRIFRITSGNVKLKGLTLENGFPSAVGGAIYFVGETLEIDSCVFRNNVSGNTSTAGGGGAIACRGKNVIIKNSYFQSNKTYGGYGAGAILHSGENGQFLVENSTFEQNTITSGDSNGSVFSFYEVVTTYTVYKGPKEISITNCTFLNNSIENRDASGAGVLTLHASMNAATACVVNNTFLFNRRDPLTSADDSRSDSEKAKTIYKRNVGIRVEGSNHKLHFINNAVSGMRYAITATLATGRQITVKNNYMITMSKHIYVSEFDVTGENVADANGNTLIIQTTNTGDPIQSAVAGLTEKMLQAKLDTTLSTDNFIPYLTFQKSSPLKNAGTNEYQVNANNIVPATDILGVIRASTEAHTGDATDIGAYEHTAESYFKTSTSGNWSNMSSWSSSADSITWKNAKSIPDAEVISTVIQSGDSVNVDNIVTTSCLKIEPGAVLNLNNNLTVSDLILTKNQESSSAFHNNEKALNITNSAKIEVAFERADLWNFISFPFGITSVKTVNGDNAVYKTNYWMKTYNIAKRIENIPAWEYADESLPIKNTGYIMWSPATLVFDANVSEVRNVFNAVAEDTDLNLTYTTAESEDNAGWNFVVHPAICKWRLTVDNDQYYYKYDYDKDNYIIESGSTFSCHNDIFNSYFIKVPESSCIVSYGLPQELRRARNTAPAERLTLKLAGNGYDYKTVLRLISESTTGYDSYDAPHMMASLNSTPQIYSFINNLKTAINSIPEQSTVNVGIRVPNNGEYTLHWDNAIITQKTFLTDNESEAIIDMSSESEYTFEVNNPGEVNNRFQVHFSTDATTNCFTPKNQIKIYTQNKSIVLDGLTEGSMVKVYDVTGKMLYNNISTNTFMSVEALNNGLYIIEIEHNGQKTVTKIIND